MRSRGEQAETQLGRWLKRPSGRVLKGKASFKLPEAQGSAWVGERCLNGERAMGRGKLEGHWKMHRPRQSAEEVPLGVVSSSRTCGNMSKSGESRYTV